MPKKRSETTASAAQISLFTSKETPDAFRKAVQIVHSKPRSPVSLLQRKLGNAWAKHAIQHSPDDSGWWTLAIRDLASDVGFDSNNRQYLKESAEALMRIVFEWDVMAPSSKKAPWKASVLFPEVEIHADIIRYQISSQMRELMINPEIYALIDMNVVRRFRRTASLAIWEFCVRFEKIGQTAEVNWEKFRDMILGETAEAKTYQEYKYFKAKVLKLAIAEINAESNLTIELLETKAGKRVTSLRFAIKRKGTATDTVTELPSEEVSLLVEFGIPASEARRLVQRYSADDIRATVDYTRRRMNDKRGDKLENPAAYLRHALQHGYASPTTQVPVKTAPPKMDLREAYHQAQVAEAGRYFRELDASDQEALIARYNLQQETTLLRLKKKPNKAAEVAFQRWLANDTWGVPTSEDLLEFAQRMLTGGEIAKF